MSGNLVLCKSKLVQKLRKRVKIQKIYLNKDSVVTDISENSENRMSKPQIKIIKKNN